LGEKIQALEMLLGMMMVMMMMMMISSPPPAFSHQIRWVSNEFEKTLLWNHIDRHHQRNESNNKLESWISLVYLISVNELNRQSWLCCFIHKHFFCLKIWSGCDYTSCYTACGDYIVISRGWWWYDDDITLQHMFTPASSYQSRQTDLTTALISTKAERKLGSSKEKEWR